MSQHKSVQSESICSMVIRGAHFFLHEKRALDAQKKPIPEKDQKYEFLGLIPKTNSDPASCQNYMLFANLAMGLVARVPEWGGKYPSPNWPIKDGDAKAANNPKNSYMAGHWVINFSANRPPRVSLLQNGQPVEIFARQDGPKVFYKSGDYLAVYTHAFTYDNQSKGIKFDVEGVCFVSSGEPIGATSRSVDEMFGSLPPMAAPQGYAPPGQPAIPQGYAPPVQPAMPMPTGVGAPQAYTPPVAPAGAPMPPQPPVAPAAPAPGGVGLPPLPPGVPGR